MELIKCEMFNLIYEGFRQFSFYLQSVETFGWMFLQILHFSIFDSDDFLHSGNFSNNECIKGIFKSIDSQ